MSKTENEQKIRYLSRYRRLNQRIDRLLEEQSRWREKAMRITPVLSPVPGGGGSGSPIERPMDKVLEIDAEINREIDALIDLRRDIQGAIEKVPDENLQLLLTYRYINGLSFEKIAEKMNYCERQIYRKHEEALSWISLS